jgi:hypothetical protein
VKKLTRKNFKKPLDFGGNFWYTIIVKGRYSPKEKMTAWVFRAGYDKKKFLKQEKTP